MKNIVKNITIALTIKKQHIQTIRLKFVSIIVKYSVKHFLGNKLITKYVFFMETYTLIVMIYILLIFLLILKA